MTRSQLECKKITSSPSYSNDDFVYSKQIKKAQEQIFNTFYGIDNKNKVILFGKPGTGKTSFVKNIVKTLKENNDEEIKFTEIKFTEIIDHRLGESLKKLDKIF